MSKILVSYFSATGNTRYIAKKLARAIHGDLFEIEPVKKYTQGDLDWHDRNSRSTIEMEDTTSRPKIKDKVKNLVDYETVVIGFPVWWYTCPTIINTFIEENNFNGKNIYVFVTSGSSNVDESFNNLKERYPNLNFVEGRRFSKGEPEEVFVNWLKNSIEK